MSYEKLQKRCMFYKDRWLYQKKEKWAYLHECRRLEKELLEKGEKIFELELKVQKLERYTNYLGELENEV